MIVELQYHIPTTQKIPPYSSRQKNFGERLSQIMMKQGITILDYLSNNLNLPSTIVGTCLIGFISEKYIQRGKKELVQYKCSR